MIAQEIAAGIETDRQHWTRIRMFFLIFYFSFSCAINGKDNFQKANICFEEAV